MSEFTLLREAIDTLAGRASSPDFGELKRRAAHRRRRRVVVVAATAAVIAGSVQVITGHDVDRRSIPVEEPKRGWTAEQVIADGDFYAFDVHESGAVLTVWTNCEDELDTDCGHAWSLVAGGRPLATGLVAQGVPHAYVRVHAGRDGFLVNDFGQDAPSMIVGLDGTVTPLPECRQDIPPLEPGRLVWDVFALDTTGVICPTKFGGGDNNDGVGEARFLSGEGAFAGNGRLWALVSNEEYETPSLNEPRLTIGTFDGSRWHYRRLAVKAQSSESLVAAAGSNVVVLSTGGVSVTTDDGTTWREVTDSTALERDLPFLTLDPEACFCDQSMAFAGSSTLYVADPRGGLWRSTDLTTFQQIDAPPVRRLQAAGDDVLALDSDTHDLLRITADGGVETLTVR